MMKPDDKDFLPSFSPGAKFAYSNFGLTVLQKVIEVRSGKPYTDYINSMAAKMGVKFDAGFSKPENKIEGEWTYRDAPGSNGTTGVAWSSDKLENSVPSSYFYDMKMLLGHGGWVTTPGDLVKSASEMGGSGGSPWISTALCKSMMARPAYVAKDDYTFYGLNWSVDRMGDMADEKFTFEHGGALEGASSLLLKGWYHRKLSTAFLFNTRVDAAAGEIKKAVEPVLAAKDADGTLTAPAK